MAVKEKKQQELSDYGADMLVLYQIDIEIDKYNEEKYLIEYPRA